MLSLELHFNIFSITLLSSGLATLLLARLIYLRVGGAVKWFSGVMCCVAIWSLAYSVELSSSDMGFMRFMIDIEYIGITLIPASLIIFILKFTGKDKWLTFKNRFLIFLFPVICLLGVWTDRFTHLHYESVGMDNSGPFPMMALKPGLLYYILTVYFYFMLAFGNYLLIGNYRKSDPVYKKQYISILIATFIPWLVNLLYLFGLRPFSQIDLTPYAFIITTGAIAFALLRYSLFNITPFAHELVIERMTTGMLVLDSHNRVIDANKAMKNFIGKNEKILGSYLDSLIPYDAGFWEKINHRSEGELSTKINDRYFEIIITPVIDKSTIYSGTILVFHDITESTVYQETLQDQKEELSNLNSLKDKIFTIISHDLRSPLASLITMLRMVKDGDFTEAEFKSFIPELSENVEYTSSLTENLLFWSRSQIKGEGLQANLFDLKPIVDKQLNYFLKSAKAKNINIISEITNETIIYAEAQMIELVLRNLISNSIKFCNADDRICISAKEENELLKLCVEDTGTGMDNLTLENLFSKESISRTGTRQEKGTGLGLLVCKDFVEKNHGSIKVESEPGRGTKFCVMLHRKSFHEEA